MVESDPNESDANAALRLAAVVRPHWTRVVPAGVALGLESHTLLHAGPPFEVGEAPSTPILNAAALCCVHEGWAVDLPAAKALIEAGGVRLQPAQDRSAVTPLAAVISPRAALVEVQDAAQPARRCWSLLPSGPGPDLRFGAGDVAILPRLAYRDERLARLVAAALPEPIDLDAIATAGLEAQDDLHGSTSGATRALAGVMLARLAEDIAAADELRGVLDASPLFYLPLWMAACRLVAAAVEAVPGSPWVTRCAGNGRRIGVTLAGAPGRWITAPAEAPAGPRMARIDASVRTCGVIGDSAIIDASGFGGAALAHAEPTRQALGVYAPPEADAIAAMILARPHPRFQRFGLRIGLDATAVNAAGIAPVVVIGMIDAAGEQGLLGRGVYRPPLALFEAAVPARPQP